MTIIRRYEEGTLAEEIKTFVEGMYLKHGIRLFEVRVEWLKNESATPPFSILSIDARERYDYEVTK